MAGITSGIYTFCDLKENVSFLKRHRNDRVIRYRSMGLSLTLHTLAIVASEHLRRVVPVNYVTGGVETGKYK